jgi:hypothetical protein
MHNLLVVVMRDSAGKNMSREIIGLLESRGIQSYFSIPYEEWQNSQGELSINSSMTLALSVMVESGLGVHFWFSATMVAKEARNVTYKERIQMTQHMQMYGMYLTLDLSNAKCI